MFKNVNIWYSKVHLQDSLKAFRGFTFLQFNWRIASECYHIGLAEIIFLRQNMQINYVVHSISFEIA